jgi:hypothetical protein
LFPEGTAEPVALFFRIELNKYPLFFYHSQNRNKPAIFREATTALPFFREYMLY